MIAEDAVWRVAGTVPVAGEYRGRDEIFELFRATRRLTDGTYLSELRWAVADGDHGRRRLPGAAADASAGSSTSTRCS